MAELEFKGVGKRYGKGPETLRDMNLRIEQGEFCVFIGPSGCGKSSLLRMVAGLEDISAGEITIDGARINETSPDERGVAMVFQSYALYPHMSVYENMAFGLKVTGGRGSDKAEIDRKVREAARVLRLDGLLERLPRELSGGQRQRVAIGRAIVRQPRVFLFDEPLSNLDAELRVQTRLEIAKLHADIGSSTMIYVTHDQVEAMTLADKIVLLNSGEAVQREGSVAQVGAPLELYHHPVNRFVAGFIGSPKMNFIEARLESAASGMARVRVGPQGSGHGFDARVDARGLDADAPVTLGIRPEHAQIGGEAGQPNTLGATVAFVEQLGEASYVYGRLADGGLFTVRQSGDTAVRIGQDIAIRCAPQSMHLFDAAGRACRRVMD